MSEISPAERQVLEAMAGRAGLDQEGLSRLRALDLATREVTIFSALRRSLDALDAAGEVDLACREKLEEWSRGEEPAGPQAQALRALLRTIDARSAPGRTPGRRAPVVGGPGPGFGSGRPVSVSVPVPVPVPDDAVARHGPQSLAALLATWGLSVETALHAACRVFLLDDPRARPADRAWARAVKFGNLRAVELLVGRMRRAERTGGVLDLRGLGDEFLQ